MRPYPKVRLDKLEFRSPWSMRRRGVCIRLPDTIEEDSLDGNRVHRCATEAARLAHFSHRHHAAHALSASRARSGSASKMISFLR
ncbi:MAG: hypothetical protein DWQ08_02820 [Proteobacteria bacterium]|nr:MAG: hypothetical protein DWQ08_02820 [Pseudomonadota bacterium]